MPAIETWWDVCCLLLSISVCLITIMPMIALFSNSGDNEKTN